jgi:carbamate kinase
LQQQYGWEFKNDGKYFRRVVPSPQPKSIVEMATIQALASSGILICGGGGGIPVVKKNGVLEGVEAVIDKDHTAALIAQQIKADMLLILTDVPAVMQGWGTEQAKKIDKINFVAARQIEFEKGSMHPKVQAACDFVEHSVGTAAIGELAAAVDIVNGSAGTHIVVGG